MTTARADRNGTYGGKDPATIPAYTIAEASHWLGIPLSTTRAWLLGQGSFAPVVEIADRAGKSLSFVNLVELHVLAAIRRKHRISLQRVRPAVEFVQERLKVRHPLANAGMLTDGTDLLVEWCGRVLNVSKRGQIEMRELLEAYLDRVERDDAGRATRLYPFSRKDVLEDPRSIVIDPRLEFGRPCLAGTGVPTAEIADRYKAGESWESLAEDYGRPREQIEEAIRYELPSAA